MHTSRQAIGYLRDRFKRLSPGCRLIPPVRSLRLLSSPTISHFCSLFTGQMIPAYCLTKTIYPWVRSPSETQTGQARRPCSKLDRCAAMATVGVLFTKFKRGTGGNTALYWIHFHISKYRRDMPFLSNLMRNLLFNTLHAFSTVPLLQGSSGTLRPFTRNLHICTSQLCKLNSASISRCFSKPAPSQGSSWKI